MIDATRATVSYRTQELQNVGIQGVTGEYIDFGTFNANERGRMMSPVEVDRSAPDVLVLDLNLPRLDGYGVLNHLRARPSTAKLPVIVLTAKGDEENEVRVFETGANDFLAKPFRPRALSARLKALLKLKT